MGSVVEFLITTPLDDGAIKDHVRQALTLGLPDAIPEAEALHVIATGPSARSLVGQIEGQTLALNGALSFYPNPTFYAACDPQALVADFLTDPPAKTAYFIASKCHPSVFEALADRDVRLWHLDDCMPGGVSRALSITLTSLNLFARMGWRRFKVYGWDCCYGPGGEHHASPQGAPQQARVNLDVDGRIFATHTTWAAEAQDAVRQLALFDFMGIDVEIMGDGMVKAVREAMREAA